SYSDANALVNTAGVFYAALSGRPEVKELIETGPLAWSAPTGSAVSFENGFKISHSYIPVQDLSYEKWTKILNALQKFLAE
ncbi:MAG: hypothetical protein GX817_07225, partial [Elusimicrobia bacterium]|nr:hypothetical protein [Elusimicrobiota bacterium]